MGGLLLVMDSYGHGDNFQPVFIVFIVDTHRCIIPLLLYSHEDVLTVYTWV